MADHPIAEKWRSDHLLLLMGTNPLPNLVSALLLTNPEATVWLLYSSGEDGEPSTKNAADNLERVLKQKQASLKVEPCPIHSSDNQKIAEHVLAILANKIHWQGRIGLNYTGGTKPMSIHAYHVLEQNQQNLSARPVFSYLDPRQLALRIDGRGPDGNRLLPIMKNEKCREFVQVSLGELTELHGYEPVNQNNSPDWASSDQTPGLFELCAEIAKVHADPSGFHEWRSWIHATQCEVLPDVSNYPHLGRVVTALDSLCGSTAAPDLIAARLRPQEKNPILKSCSKWFGALWLEEYALTCLERLAGRFHHISCGKNLEYRAKKERSDKFELDVAAIIGYQLFAISCCTADKKEKAKEHLLEAFVRARQLGGDEARVGLVCCTDDPEQLRKEIAREWDAEGKLRVFGRSHLRDLGEAFEQWFQAVIR